MSFLRRTNFGKNKKKNRMLSQNRTKVNMDEMFAFGEMSGLVEISEIDFLKEQKELRKQKKKYKKKFGNKFEDSSTDQSDSETSSPKKIKNGKKKKKVVKSEGRIISALNENEITKDENAKDEKIKESVQTKKNRKKKNKMLIQKDDVRNEQETKKGKRKLTVLNSMSDTNEIEMEDSCENEPSVKKVKVDQNDKSRKRKKSKKKRKEEHIQKKSESQDIKDLSYNFETDGLSYLFSFSLYSNESSLLASLLAMLLCLDIWLPRSLRLQLSCFASFDFAHVSVSLSSLRLCATHSRCFTQLLHSFGFPCYAMLLAHFAFLDFALVSQFLCFLMFFDMYS